MRRRLLLVVGLVSACRYRFDALADANGDAIDDGPGLDAPTSLEINVIGDGALIGTGIECDGTCTVPRTGQVPLMPFAGQGWRLVSLDTAPCAAGVCIVPADVGAVTATFERLPYTTNIAFVSSVPTALTGGLATIDSFCQTRATAAGLPGTYVALLATTGNVLANRIVGSRGWVRTDGLPVVDLAATGSTTSRAVVLDENGAPQVGVVVTGSDFSGTPIGTRCNEWTTETGQVDGGRAEFIGGFGVGGQSLTSCTGRVYCFGIGLNVPVTINAAFPMGRYIFTSRTAFAVTVGGGIAAADARCQADATAASLPGTYRAVLATSTESAATHIGSLAGRWRRPDGVVVSRNGLVPPFDATVNVDATGALVNAGNFTMLGATTMTSTGTVSCSNWTDPALTYHYGNISSTTLHNANSCCASCTDGQLVCAQL